MDFILENSEETEETEGTGGILLCKNKFSKNIHLPKHIFPKNLFLSGNTKILVSYIVISVSGYSAFFS